MADTLISVTPRTERDTGKVGGAGRSRPHRPRLVAAGQPVVALLPPGNMKVRFFVPESAYAAIKAGDKVKVTITGQPPIDARVSYLSPKPEYTPPVLYNRENRAKLVFMIEAVFDPAVARDLHPGQPVDVSLTK